MSSSRKAPEILEVWSVVPGNSMQRIPLTKPCPRWKSKRGSWLASQNSTRVRPPPRARHCLDRVCPLRFAFVAGRESFPVSPQSARQSWLSRGCWTQRHPSRRMQSGLPVVLGRSGPMHALGTSSAPRSMALGWTVSTAPEALVDKRQLSCRPPPVSRRASLWAGLPQRCGFQRSECPPGPSQ